VPEAYDFILVGSTDYVFLFSDSSHDGGVIIKDCFYIIKYPVRAKFAPRWAVGNDMGHGAIICP
jgi:hypothetical protein